MMNRRDLVFFSAASLVLAGCPNPVAGYDNLVEKDEVVNQKWADVQAQLQRRHDLIPRLVNTVKGFAKQEKEVLTAVTEARAAATSINITPADLEDPEKMKQLQAAQGKLSSSLSKLLVVQEKYPNLKSDKAFVGLQAQIEGTENRILRARKEYNASVKAFNVALRKVSGKVINPLTNNEFKPKVYYQAEAGATAAPDVSF
ncbi:MAG: LemA family protein [Myxococcota bacterium]